MEPGRPDSARLGQLVAITFTERAAREMRDRIREKCRSRLIECPEEEAEHWLELLRELDSARISTIHSFCALLLRSYAVEAGLDPRFRVLDQVQADTLLNEMIDDQLRERLADQEKPVVDLIIQFGLRRLAAMIAQLLSRRQEIDWDCWLAVDAGSLVSRWGKYHHDKALPLLLQQVVASDEAKTVLEIARLGPSANPEMKSRIAFLLDALPHLGESTDAQAIVAKIREAAKIQGAGSKKEWISEELYEKYREAAKKLRETIDAIKDKLDFDPEKALPAAETGLCLLALAGEVGHAYQEEKQSLAALDFNDLLIRAKELLTGPAHAQLRKRWAANLRLLLVDEFQDTDPLQVQLVKALCDDQIASGKLFFVGDFKQSIYRFRGADPRVFHSLREEIPQEGRLPLSLNFRSQPAVLDFVNALFCREFSEFEALNPNRPQTGPSPAVEFLWATENEFEKDEDGPTGSDLSDRLSAAQAKLLKAGDESGADDQTPSERRRRREADWIARRIRGMIDSGEKIVCDQVAAKTGNFTARAVKFGDIALLFRALTNIEYYEAALRRYDIPYYLVGGHAFYAQQEVFDLLNLLRSLESACDQVSLLGAAQSFFQPGR